VVTTVYKASEVYDGPEVPNGPDLIVGFNRGYRSSDDSALGTLSNDIILPNLSKWTGDHCIDHQWVPGVLITNRRVLVPDPALVDIPVTIIRLFGVEPPAAMTGRDVFAPVTGASGSH
jgi:predicted AlkP superfamily phosphohydrolase/phosphomutase